MTSKLNQIVQGAAQSDLLAEWSYLDGQQRRLLSAILIGLSILPVALQTWMLPPTQASLAGIALFAATLIGFGAAHLHHRVGLLCAAIGIGVGIGLMQQWWMGPGAGALWLIPAILATQFVGGKLGLIGAGIVVSVLSGPHLFGLPPIGASERTALLIVLAVHCAGQWGVQYRGRQLMAALLGEHRRVRAELDAVRDQRLAVKQVHQDLADAFIQLRKLNELLQASRLEAERARQAKEEFVANVSHELRTPLNMIIGLSEMIVAAPDSYMTALPPALVSDIRVIHRNSEHLSQLINDVLDLSQTEAGRLPLHREWIAPAQIVDEAMEAIQPLFQARGLSLDRQLAHNLPDVYCDRVRVRQVLLNLLSNAGRFVTEGGACIHVQNGAGSVTFEVRDSGPGIPAEALGKIFEPFHQANAPHASNRAGGWSGSGLGLSICRQFVELHGGKMWVQSEYGRGASFYFSLPLPVEALPVTGATRWVNPFASRDPYQKQSDAPLPTPTRRLLMLDPGQVLARRARVEWPEAEITVVERVDQLAAEVERVRPDVLLINDIEVMNDRRLLHHAMTLPRPDMPAGTPKGLLRLPILSCYIPAREEAWQSLNVAGYLIKPVMREALLDAVARVAPERQSGAEGAAILVVEDDRDTARLTRRQLASAQKGYRIVTVNSGADALETLRTRKIDVVCLDMSLPDFDGYELLREKNGDERIRDVPVLVVSAQDPTGLPGSEGTPASRVRVETAVGLSVRDLVRCAMAMDWAFSPDGQAKGGRPGPA